MADDRFIDLVPATKEAAGWALRLLEKQTDEGWAEAEQLYQRLQECPPRTAVQMLLGLVNLPGRFGVGAPDTATLKLRLRYAAGDESDHAYEASFVRDDD